MGHDLMEKDIRQEYLSTTTVMLVDMQNTEVRVQKNCEKITREANLFSKEDSVHLRRKSMASARQNISRRCTQKYTPYQ